MKYNLIVLALIHHTFKRETFHELPLPNFQEFCNQSDCFDKKNKIKKRDSLRFIKKLRKNQITVKKKPNDQNFLCPKNNNRLCFYRC